MGEVGRKALVISSAGFHSRKYIGMTGVSVAKLDGCSTTPRWVLRFSSSLFGNEEGLYDDWELKWL